jgi:hypothetical protein
VLINTVETLNAPLLLLLLLLLLLCNRVLNLVRPAAGLLFLVFPVAIMDMLSGVFMCDWRHLDQPVSLLWPAAGEAARSAQ